MYKHKGEDRSLWELVRIPTSTYQYIRVLTQFLWTDGSVYVFTEE